MTENTKSAKEWLSGRVDLREKLNTRPPPLDFVIPGLAAGTVGLLTAPGSVGKSFFALQSAIHIAAASISEADTLETGTVKSGRVLFLAAEDAENALWHRLHSIGTLLPHETSETLVENLHIVPLVGSRMNIGSDDWFNAILEAAQGSRLVIVDTWSRVHQEDESVNAKMGPLLNRLEAIANVTRAAFLILHHVSKSVALSGAGDSTHASRGASALVDNSRFAAFLQRMNDADVREIKKLYGIDLAEEPREYLSQFIRYGVSKCSYGRIPADRWFRQDTNGVLVPWKWENHSHTPASAPKMAGSLCDV
ncbi:MAG: helicase RepA family protein [Proteobacteria bacterium]|nr:helicase RepA family protein [Pseudomonadota bacterium]